MSSQTQTKESEATNLDCIHCGICLGTCPTYLKNGNEADSPRGRIYLINAAKEGRADPRSNAFQDHMQLCLECRACESACPSGVRFSVMMYEARALIRRQAKLSRFAAALRYVVFVWLLPSRGWLHLLFRALRLYQRGGIQVLVRRSRVLRLFPNRISLMESILPVVPRYPRYDQAQKLTEQARCKVSFFEGCVMPELFGPVHEATLRVLARNRVAVCRPSRQTCCGALHLHDGEVEGALALARRNIDAFEKDGCDFIVVNAAGCGAMLKEYGQLLSGDRRYAKRAADFSCRVKDICEFLENLGISGNLKPLHLRVAYDDPCHLLHGQGIKAAPRNLLRSIPGLELVELRNADRCCGSAGIYNITQPEMSAAILEDKIEDVRRSGAQAVATGNPGCLLQIKSGLEKNNLRIQVLHPVELLDRSYAGSA